MRDASDTNDESSLDNHGGIGGSACGSKQTAEMHPWSEYVELGEERVGFHPGEHDCEPCNIAPV